MWLIWTQKCVLLPLVLQQGGLCPGFSPWWTERHWAGGRPLCICSDPCVRMRGKKKEALLSMTLPFGKTWLWQRDNLTCRPKPGCWAWWPHRDGRDQRSSPGPPALACRGGRPPRTCPGTRTGWPGCAGFSGGLGSRSLPAEPQPKLRCCVDAALWGGQVHGAKVSLSDENVWYDYAVSISIYKMLVFRSLA